MEVPKPKYKIWTPVPDNAKICKDAIMGVYLLPDEDVDWIWSADGTYVIGYTIKEKLCKRQ